MSAPGPETERVHAELRARIAEHRSELVRFARSRARSADEGDDAVQETVVRALAHEGSLRDAASARAWLFTILRRVLADRARTALREVPRSDELDALPAESSDEGGDATCGCAPRLTSTLEPSYVEILERVDLDDRGVGEVARELGITANNAGVRLHRARRALRDRIRELCGVATFAEARDCECAASDCG